LIDADLRRPTLHAIYGLARSPGLTQVLRGQAAIGQAVQATPVENLALLAAGPEVGHPAELLATERLGEVLAELRRAYDVVLFDSSPLLVVTDPSIIAAEADGILLVVRASVTRRHDAERTRDLLQALGTNTLGLVINGVDTRRGGYGYGYGYGYLYGYGTYGRAAAPGEGEPPAASGVNGNGHHAADGSEGGVP
jgi:capsular exopolysaccharide synthesis family protein